MKASQREVDFKKCIFRIAEHFFKAQFEINFSFSALGLISAPHEVWTFLLFIMFSLLPTTCIDRVCLIVLFHIKNTAFRT